MSEKSNNDPTVKSFSLRVGDRTIHVADLGGHVSIVITGVSTRIHPGKLLRRIVLGGEAGREFVFTDDTIVALYRLLEETEPIKRLLKRRERVEAILREHRLRAMFRDPNAPEWECT